MWLVATTLDSKVLSDLFWPLWVSGQHLTSFLHPWQEHFSQGI